MTTKSKDAPGSTGVPEIPESRETLGAGHGLAALPCSALANDVARCNGVGSDDPDEGWRDGCETCLRRTAPRPKRCLMMEPPSIIAFECEFLIEPNTKLNDTNQ